ncbi:unnamed protein product, partial [Mesorhabditis spiculigera]
MLKFLFFAFLLVASAYAACNVQQIGILSYCYKNFLGFYGLNFNGTLPPYWTMHKARSKMLQRDGMDAQPAICDAARTLFSCTNNVLYDYTCLVDMGLNMSDAKDYMTDKAVGNYQCTDGYQVLVKDFYCIGYVRDHFYDELKNCTDTMNEQINKGGNVCNALNDFLACQPPYYANGCNYNVGVFACGTDRAGVNANGNYCDRLGLLNKCPPYREFSPLLLVGSIEASCDASQTANVGACYYGFFNFYGINLSAGFPTYWDFHQVRGKLLRDNGISIQPQVCQAAVKLSTCVHKMPYDPQCFMAFGLNLTDATDYQADIAVGNYQCTDGYATLLKDFTCLGMTRAKYHTVLQACSDALDAAIANGTNLCPAYNTFLNCQSPWYVSGCDFNAGVFMCGTNRAGILANDDHCEKAGLLNKCPEYN